MTHRYYLKCGGTAIAVAYCGLLLAAYVSAARLVSAERKAGPAAKPRRGLRAYHVALGLQVLGWYAQLHPGHKLFEGVKPALADALGQSLGVAPLFAFYEGAWALGFDAAAKDRVAALVADERRAMCVDRAHGRFDPALAFCAHFARAGDGRYPHEGKPYQPVLWGLT